MTTVREDVLAEAITCVTRDRNIQYDTPEKNFDRIAKFWNTYLEGRLTVPIEPHDTAVMVALIKVARIMSSPAVKDHWVDLAGYAACGFESVNEAETVEDEVWWRDIGYTGLPYVCPCGACDTK